MLPGEVVKGAVQSLDGVDGGSRPSLAWAGVIGTRLAPAGTRP
jgi:hypothetical protein